MKSLITLIYARLAFAAISIPGDDLPTQEVPFDLSPILFPPFLPPLKTRWTATPLQFLKCNQFGTLRCKEVCNIAKRCKLAG